MKTALVGLGFMGTMHLNVYAELGVEIAAICDKNIDQIDLHTLEVKGKLYPDQQQNTTRLKGKADLKVRVDIPFPLSMTPQPIIETTGNGLLKSVLLRIKNKLMHQLLSDYRQWANADRPTLAQSKSQHLAPVDNPSI